MDFLEGSLQVFELASCLLLQPQRCFHPPLHLPLFVRFLHTFFVQPRCFPCNVWLFSNCDPTSAIFALSTTPSQISETARTAGRCDRRGARTTPRLCPASPLAASPSAEIRLQPFFFCVCRVRNAPARRRNVRFSGFRWVTRSAAPRKPHKPPTRARRAVTGVLSVRSTCVFNKIGIFSPCCVLVQLLHLPVIVLLECRLNRSDCE